MGSFNTTCFASQQTISEGNDCVVIPILQSSTYEEVKGTARGKPFSGYGIANSNCHLDSFWQPMGAPLQARYADYGRFELLETEQNRKALYDFIAQLCASSMNAPALRSFMQEDAPVAAAHFFREDGAPRGPAPDFDELFQCWNFVADQMSDYKLFCEQLHPSIQRPVALAVMHTRTFEALVTLHQVGKTYRGESMDMLEVIKRALGQAFERVGKYKEMEPSVKPKMLDYVAKSSFGEQLKYIGNDQGRSMPGEGDIYEALQEQGPLESISPESLLELLRPTLRTRYAYAALDSMNLRFSPMVYAGQDYSNEMGRRYAGFVHMVSQQVSRAQDVHHYGEYNTFEVRMACPQCFSADALVKNARDFDARANILELTTCDTLGKKALKFEATMNLADMSDFLAQFSEEFPDMDMDLSSLKQCS